MARARRMRCPALALVLALPLALSLVAASLLVGCQYGFDELCREGEVCEPGELGETSLADPDVGQVRSCSLMRGVCGDSETCSFTIEGNTIPSPPACRSSSGYYGVGRACEDASSCARGLTCYRALGETTGSCVDLCQVAGDCLEPGMTCDRSAPIATISGVPFYRCLNVRDPNY